MTYSYGAFIKNIFEGKINNKNYLLEFDKAVEGWHKCSTICEIHEFLGITKKVYISIIEKPEVLKNLIYICSFENLIKLLDRVDTLEKLYKTEQDSNARFVKIVEDLNLELLNQKLKYAKSRIKEIDMLKQVKKGMLKLEKENKKLKKGNLWNIK